MVGVAGRSKGCRTCLRRRVKCDEGQPTCNKCGKAAYKCEGYARPLEFRSHVFTKDGSPRMLTQKRGRPPATMELVLRLNHNQPIQVPEELSLIAFKNDMQFAYLFENFVWSSYGTPWLELAALGRMSTLSLAACHAFAQTVYGKHHRLRDIEVEAGVSYCQTVRTLSLELGHVDRPGSEALIVPIMILLMHASTIPDPQAAFFHAKGLMKLLQLCGPKRFSRMPLRQAFESCRATLFTIALISKTNTFLSAPEWKSEPWNYPGGSPKSPQNELVDLLVDIPGMLDDAAKLAHTESPQPEVEGKLINRLKLSLGEAYNWRWRWQARNADAVWELDPDGLPPGKGVGEFRLVHEVLWFSSFTHATEICLYNAVLLCLLGLLWQFEPPRRHGSIKVSTSPLMLPGDFSTLYEPAEEICRAFEFQLLNVAHCRESALFWLFPLGLASKVLEDDPGYGRWVKDMLDRSYITRGYGTGNNSYGFGSYKFPKIGKPRRWEAEASRGVVEAD